MISKILALTICFFCFFIQFVASNDIIGEIDHISGEVEITRNGEIYESYDLEEGTELENYDLIRTLDDGEVSVIIDSPLCPETIVQVDSDTTFSLEINKLESRNETTLSMITGALALKVQGLSSKQSFQVESESAVMGVRGTSFSVGASPDGGVLVACEEGKVQCKNEDGDSLDCMPGKVVENIPGESFKQIPVAISSLKKFRKEWLAERIDAFKPNALKAIRQYAKKYKEMVLKFDEAYDSLKSKEDMIAKWIKENKAGKVGSKMEIMKEKKKIIGDLFKLRRILFIFEKIYFRLIELKGYYDQGYGKGLVREGLTTKQFFQKFAKQSRILQKKVAKVKFLMKLYAKRNNGKFPADVFADDDEADDNDDDFFGDDDF